jgi:hypothetical protein
LEITESFESVQSIPLAGKTVTLSFYGRKGADYTAASDALTFRLVTGTGTDQNLVTAGYTGQSDSISATATLTSTWQRFSATVTLPSTVTEMGVRFRYTPVGTASTNDFFEITGVQVEVGAIPTQFSRAGGTIQGELAACQRYYWRSSGGSTYTVSGFGFCNSATTAYIGVNLPVAMRTAPASVDFSAQNLNDAAANYAVTAISLTATWKATTMVMLETTVASGLTTNRPIFLTNNNNAAGYVGLSAEL